MGLFKSNIEKLRVKGDIKGLREEGDIEGIIKALLEHKDYNVRCEAARVLGYMKETRAVEPLVMILMHPDYWVAASSNPSYCFYWDKVRTEAIQALGKIGDAKAVAPLIVAMIGMDSPWTTEEALAKIEEPAVEYLIRILTTKDPEANIKELITEALEPYFSALGFHTEAINKEVDRMYGLLKKRRLRKPFIIEGMGYIEDPQKHWFMDGNKLRWSAAYAACRVGGEKAIRALSEVALSEGL
jgi:HEAT repeat protein